MLKRRRHYPEMCLCNKIKTDQTKACWYALVLVSKESINNETGGWYIYKTGDAFA